MYDKEYWDSNYGSIEQYNELLCINKISLLLQTLYISHRKNTKDKTEVITGIDIGGATGIIADKLEKLLRINTHLNAKIYNFDVSSHAIKTGHGLLVNVAYDNFPIVDYSVDFIYSIQVLEHLYQTEIENVLYQIYKKLKTNGLCFLSVAPENNVSDRTHVTLKPSNWWEAVISYYGFRCEKHFSEIQKELNWVCFLLTK